MNRGSWSSVFLAFVTPSLHTLHYTNQLGEHTSIILTVYRWRYKDQKFKVILGDPGVQSCPGPHTLFEIKKKIYEQHGH